MYFRTELKMGNEAGRRGNFKEAYLRRILESDADKVGESATEIHSDEKRSRKNRFWGIGKTAGIG
jgi:hypothetical protein